MYKGWITRKTIKVDRFPGGGGGGGDISMSYRPHTILEHFVNRRLCPITQTMGCNYADRGFFYNLEGITALEYSNVNIVPHCDDSINHIASIVSRSSDACYYF